MLQVEQIKKPPWRIKYYSIGVSVTDSDKEKMKLIFKYPEWIIGNLIFKLSLLLPTSTLLNTDA